MSNNFKQIAHSFKMIMIKHIDDITFRNKVLEITNGIGTPGVIRWQLVLCLLAAWGIAFLCLIKGIETSGKVI